MVALITLFLFCSCKKTQNNESPTPTTAGWTISSSLTGTKTYTPIQTNLSGGQLYSSDINSNVILIIFYQNPQANTTYTVKPINNSPSTCRIDISGQAIGGGAYGYYGNQGSVLVTSSNNKITATFSGIVMNQGAIGTGQFAGYLSGVLIEQ